MSVKCTVRKRLKVNKHQIVVLSFLCNCLGKFVSKFIVKAV